MAAAAPCDSETYGRLNGARRVWAVACVRGEAGRLAGLQDQLLRRLAPGDRMVHLGDYLGYGPDGAATLDAIIAFRRRFLARENCFLGDFVLLRGRQEEMWQKLLELQFAPNPREVRPWMLEHGVAATLDSYGIDSRQGLSACRDGARTITRWTATLRAAIEARPGHRQFLTALKRAAFTEPGGLFFVNAGVDPEKPLELQRDVFWWGGRDILELETPFAGFARVIGGMDRRHAGLAEGRYALALDAGCGYGGPLMAACFAPDGEVLERLEA